MTVTLDCPVTIERPFGTSAPVSAIRVAADEPADFGAVVERARQGDPPQERVAAALQPGRQYAPRRRKRSR